MRDRLVVVFAAAAFGVVGLAGCDDSDPRVNPFDPAPDAPKKPPPLTSAAAKPAGPPEFVIDTISPKVGFTRVLLKKPEDAAKLVAALKENKDHVVGKEVPLTVDRKVPTKWVSAFVTSLAEVGASSVLVKTETRPEFAAQLQFTPARAAVGVPSCSVVAMILEDRSTAVWKLSGGTAARRSKGFAGPDLTMTGETLQRKGKACKASDTIFVSAPDAMEWGLTYDLAASSKKVEKVEFKRAVLLPKAPTPGRKVELAGG